MLLGLKTIDNIALDIGNGSIHVVGIVNLVGITIDLRLNFDQHVANFVSRGLFAEFF